MFLSQKLKQSAIITNKIVKYQLTDGLPNDETLKKKFKTPWNYSLVSRLFPKIKMLSKLARNY